MPSWVSTVLPQMILLTASCVLALGSRMVRLEQFWKPFTLIAVLCAATALVNETRYLSRSPVAGTDRQDVPSQSAEDRPADKPPRALIQDPFSIGLQWACLLLGTMLILIALGSPAHSPVAMQFSRLLLSMTGAMLACVAYDLMLLFIAFELAVLPLAMQPASSLGKPAQTAIGHHLALGLVASVLLLLGFAALYGLSGSTNVAAIRDTLTPESTLQSSRVSLVSQLGIVAMVLVFAGLAAPLGIVPFHLGWPENFERAPSDIVGQHLTWPRIAALVVLMRVCCQAMASLESTGQWIAWVLAVSSMTIGGLRALAETNVRRRLAYATLAHGGIILAGMAVGFWELGHPAQGLAVGGLPGGLKASLACFLCHLFAAVGFVAILSYLQKPGRQVEHLDALKGIVRSEPVVAVCALVFLLSLAGCPPLPGFWSNLLVLSSCVLVPAEFAGELLPAPAAGFSLLSLLTVVGMLLIAAGHLRIVATILLEGQIARPRAAGGQAARAAALWAALMLCGAGLLPGPLLGALDRIDLARPASTAEAR